MHLILRDRGKLLPYLAAWVPVAGLLAILLQLAGDIGWAEALLIAIPMSLLCAFQSLAFWYLCLATPLGSTGLRRLVAVHGTGAVLSCVLWLGAGRVLVFALQRAGLFDEGGRRFTSQVSLLFTVGVLLFVLASAVHYVMIAFEASVQAERRALEQSLLARGAELKALKGQINPHFLFNSLNSISSLAGSDSKAARAMCVELATLFRSILKMGSQERVPLSSELELVSSQLAVEQIRFGARLRVEIQVEDGCAGLLVPPLLLQPLVENAVTHGIAHLVEGGLIRVAAGRKDGALVLSVENPFDQAEARPSAAGVGLDNVRRRLAAIHGVRARLETTQRPDGLFSVELTLPLGEDP